MCVTDWIKFPGERRTDTCMTGLGHIVLSSVCLPVTLAVCELGPIQSASGLPGRGTLGRFEAGAGPPPLEPVCMILMILEIPR